MKYTSAVGTKFDADGSVAPFPGNTVICMVDPASDTQRALLATRDLIRSGLGPVDGKYSYLPEDSYHMTVFDCVCDKVRTPGAWPKGIALDAPLEEVDEYLIGKWNEIAVPKMPFRMVYDRAEITEWIMVRLKPESQAVEREIRGFRDELSRVFGIRHRIHDEYYFHITLAYGIVRIEDSDRPVVDSAIERADKYLRANFGVFEASAPRLGFFPDMFSFPAKRTTG